MWGFSLERMFCQEVEVKPGFKVAKPGADSWDHEFGDEFSWDYGAESRAIIYKYKFIVGVLVVQVLQGRVSGQRNDTCPGPVAMVRKL